MNGVLKIIKMYLFKKMWRRNNINNYTVAKTSFNINNVSVGNFTYGDLNIKHYNHDASLNIGCYCSIADEVVFILGGVHNYKRISSWPFYSRIYKNAVISNENPHNYSIEVGNDV